MTGCKYWFINVDILTAAELRQTYTGFYAFGWHPRQACTHPFEQNYVDLLFVQWILIYVYVNKIVSFFWIRCIWLNGNRLVYTQFPFFVHVTTFKNIHAVIASHQIEMYNNKMPFQQWFWNLRSRCSYLSEALWNVWGWCEMFVAFMK